MSIIVYRDGIMAADSQVSAGDRRSGLATKIVRNKHGGFAGAAGELSVCHLFREWFAQSRSGAFVPPPSEQGFGAIMVDASGLVTRMDHNGKVYPAPEAAYHIEGCAEEVAAGALEHGATAEEAVLVACRVHNRCCGPIVTERLASLDEKEAVA